MIYRKLGTTDIKVSSICLGTWAIGGLGWGGTEEIPAIDAIHAALDNGINFIDTAPVYGIGQSEEIVGKAVRHRRDKVVLATKAGHIWHMKKGRHVFDWEGKNVYIYLGAESIIYEVEQSLKRLQTDYIDLYQVHWPDPSTPIEETMNALVKLREQGKIRSIGLSNVSDSQLDKYRSCGAVSTDQEHFSMLQRKMGQTRLDYCCDNEITFLAYSPLAQGLLTGKININSQFNKGDFRSSDELFQKGHIEMVTEFLERIKPLVDKHNAAFSQIALAWCVAQNERVIPIAGARSVAHAEQNANAGEIVLDGEDLQLIDSCLLNYNEKYEKYRNVEK